MLPIGAVLVDFDGTACTVDVAEQMLIAFGDPSWSDYDEAVDRGEIGLREAIQAQNAMIDATREDLVSFALANCPLDPTFAPFVEWLEIQDVPAAIVSDGFGFYIEPILQAADLAHVPVFTNQQLVDAAGRPAGLRFVNAHPDCVGCGTCKMLAVQRYRAEYGALAFVGEGKTDRYGALYADLVFAKDALVDHCRRDGIPFLPWRDFRDVRRSIEGLTDFPGPIAPRRCPGWSLPVDRRG
ncbi:MAG: HAD-IB family phosphatase [Actinomycetota bacterium]|nr:HAD-IB family phosphatase [Actinomycetota bacterium]